MKLAFVLAGALVFVIACAYFAITAWWAKQQVADAPKQDMFLCPEHGPMRGDLTHTLFDGAELDQVSSDGKTLRAPVRICPMCFEAKIKEARSK